MRASLRTDKDNLRHESIFVRRVPCNHLTRSFCTPSSRDGLADQPARRPGRCTQSFCKAAITGQSSHTTVLAKPASWTGTGTFQWRTMNGRRRIADHECRTMNGESRSRDHSPWTLYRTGLFTAHVPRSRIHRCGPAFAGRGEGRLPSSGDWQMRLFIGRARLCPSCGYLPSFADS